MYLYSSSLKFTHKGGLTVVSKDSHPLGVCVHTRLDQSGPVACGIATNVLTSNLVCSSTHMHTHTHKEEFKTSRNTGIWCIILVYYDHTHTSWVDNKLRHFPVKDMLHYTRRVLQIIIISEIHELRYCIRIESVHVHVRVSSPCSLTLVYYPTRTYHILFCAPCQILSFTIVHCIIIIDRYMYKVRGSHCKQWNVMHSWTNSLQRW